MYDNSPNRVTGCKVGIFFHSLPEIVGLHRNVVLLGDFDCAALVIARVCELCRISVQLRFKAYLFCAGLWM